MYAALTSQTSSQPNVALPPISDFDVVAVAEGRAFRASVGASCIQWICARHVRAMKASSGWFVSAVDIASRSRGTTSPKV